MSMNENFEDSIDYGALDYDPDQDYAAQFDSRQQFDDVAAQIDVTYRMDGDAMITVVGHAGRDAVTLIWLEKDQLGFCFQAR